MYEKAQLSNFILVIGVGKTSLVHLLVKGSSIDQPPQTVGCTVGVKVGNSLPLSSKITIQSYLSACPEFAQIPQCTTPPRSQCMTYCW